MSGTKDTRPEADSISAAATSIKDGIVNAGSYVKERVTASPSGASGSTSSDVGKDHSAAAKADKEAAKDHAQAAVDKAGDSVKESYNAAGDKIQDKKEDVKESYDKNVTDKIQTNPIEESRAQGEIPANTAAVKTVSAEK